MIKQSFTYSNLSNYGNYIFYYDSKSGKLKYTFKYARLPRFGRYSFLYSPQDRITIEESIKMQKIHTNIEYDTSEIQLHRECVFRLDVNNPVKYLNNISSTKNIMLVKDSSFYLRRFRENRELASIEEQDFQLDTKTLNEFYVFEEDDFQIEKNINHNIGIVEINSQPLEKMKILLNISTPHILYRNVNSIKASILKDSFLIKNIDRIAEIDKVVEAKESLRDIIINSDTKLNNKNFRDVDINKSKSLHINDRKGKIEEYQITEIGKRTINTDLTTVSVDNENNRAVQSNFNKAIQVKKMHKDINNEDLGANIKKDYKKTNADSIHTNIKKDYKDTHIQPHSTNTRKTYKDINIEYENITNKENKSIDLNKDIVANNTTQNGRVETDTLSRKSNKEMSIQGEEKATNSTIDIFTEDIKKLKTEQRELQEEVEEKLKLHKRFWFLDNIGKMDIKILPNKDFQYPPKIEIFENPNELHTFMYNYKDRYSNIDDEYIIKLYKTSLQGFTEVAKHTVLDLSMDYDNIIEGIEIKTKNEIISDESYPNKIYFEINIDDIDFDYMIIEQPDGFMGNKFVFVTSEKFLVENHPIPLGEDMGLFEMPISIGIMVDFVNILMLIWSKFYMSYSGCVGTRAIQSMVDRVYEWLTLETSLEEESIEAYNRCYRWFRWECEKVYNKAKLDPNLHGNRWIEEVVFEMIDYMDMHHFDNMPEWDDVERMDEQRNEIFQDVNLDIEIVVEKFKGIRKRVANKNKRFRDF